LIIFLLIKLPIKNSDRLILFIFVNPVVRWLGKNFILQKQAMKQSNYPMAEYIFSIVNCMHEKQGEEKY